MRSLSRGAVTAVSLVAALLPGLPAAHAEPVATLRISLSGTTPGVSAAADPDGAVAAISGVVDGVTIDTTACEVTTSDPAGAASGTAALRISGCADSAVEVEVADGGDGGAVTAQLKGGPRPGDCVLLCTWRFDIREGWWLDCLFGASV